MTATLDPAATVAVPARTPRLPFGLLADLEHPRDAVAHLTPNWFASVMGTGIVATAAATLPGHVPGLRGVALAMWALAGGLLVTLLAATAVHWARYPRTARRHLDDPVAGHFYGAPAMAVLTVGAGTLLVGRDVLGAHLALAVDAALWAVGTAGGLVTTVLVPYRQFVRGGRRAAEAFGGWLMPVVPPMVSASTGALLVPHIPAGRARTTLLVSCYGLFALALLASVAVVALIVRRLVTSGVGAPRSVPTYWIVLGPLGQSVTAANLLGGVAGLALPARYAGPLRAFGVDFGLPVLGLALGWAVVAAALTVRATPPFTLAWWSFTFPLGTCVTGAGALSRHAELAGLRWVAVAGFAALAAAWVVVAARTASGAARGRLLLA